MTKVAIVDYGMGNLHSVEKALRYVSSDANVYIAKTPEAIKQADRVVLPGQGAIAGCMKHIQEKELTIPIFDALKNKPFLAICVGPQLLMDWSEENGGVSGLSFFKGKCVGFDPSMLEQDPPLKIPHMGWSQVYQDKKHPLWEGIDDGARFYFVHSYYLEPEDSDVIVGSCVYGHRFASALAKDNVFTTQCHPEKSSQIGLRLFKNFIDWTI